MAKKEAKTDERRIFQAPAILDGISPLKDKGMSIRFHTNELSTEQQVIMLTYYQKFGYVTFAEDANQGAEMIVETGTDIENRKIKTPSQRLRGKIWRVWKETTDQSMDADEYYKREMEKLINYEDRKINSVDI
ncbi:MAG: hypothetical protein M0R80_18480 [Proteobacteria bacterium]|jgi:hypothetical protein|nr:hypothetical protein [Pseudomonadota bacterium]